MNCFRGFGGAMLASASPDGVGHFRLASLDYYAIARDNLLESGLVGGSRILCEEFVVTHVFKR